LSAFDECVKVLAQCKKLPVINVGQMPYRDEKAMSAKKAIELADSERLDAGNIKKAYMALAMQGTREGESLFSTTWVFNVLSKIRSGERRRT